MIDPRIAHMRQDLARHIRATRRAPAPPACRGLVRPEGQRQGGAFRQRDVLGVAQFAVRLRPALAFAAYLGIRIALAQRDEDRLLDGRGEFQPGVLGGAGQVRSNASRSM